MVSLHFAFSCLVDIRSPRDLFGKTLAHIALRAKKEQKPFFAKSTPIEQLLTLITTKSCLILPPPLCKFCA
jgi:hypothetical protein